MTWFETFFKYKPIVYEKGSLGFQLIDNPLFFLVLAIGSVVGAFFLYRKIQGARVSLLNS